MVCTRLIDLNQYDIFISFIEIIDNVFEGDIVLTPNNKVDQSTTGDVDGPLSNSDLNSSPLSFKRNAQRSRLGIWKTKRVPYEFASDMRKYFIQISSTKPALVFGQFDEHQVF